MMLYPPMSELAAKAGSRYLPKARPRYIISERTWTKQNEDEEKGE